MAIIYSYPEIPDVQGGDLLLISDTGAPNKPTRSVDIDDLAAYIGTVIGIGFWNLGTAPDSIFTTKMASIGQNANIASSKLNVYKTDDMTASVPHIATFNESSSNHSLNLWPSPGGNSADIYGSVSRGTFTGSGTVEQIIGSSPISRHSGSGSVNFIQGTQATASLTGSGSAKTIVASYAKTFIEGTGSNNIENAFGAWNVVELDGLNDVDTIYGTYTNLVLKNGEVNDDAIGHFIDFDQVSADTEINNAYYIHAINDSLSVTGEKFFIKDETGIPSQFSNKLVLNAYGSGAFTGTATQRLAVDTNGNVIEIPIGSGPVDGSGTANYAARWIDTDTLGIGALYDNGTNVGIGTTSPDYLFEVEKTTSGSATLASFKNTENTGIRISRTGASPGTSVFNVVNNGALYTSSDSHIVFQPGNSTSVFMQSTGNVGIGTTSPDYALHVDPVVKIGDRQGTDGSLIIQSQQGPNITFTSSGDALNISGSTGSSNGNFIRLQDDIKVFEFMPNIGGTIIINRGNRGLMDTSIGGYVVQSQNTTGSNGKSTFLSTDSSGTILRSTSYGSIGTSGDIQFQFGGGNNTSEPAPATKMIIKNDGNVGVGTTSPSQKLEVVGNIQATGTRSISSSFDANHYMRIESNSSGGILKGTDGGVITTLVRTYGDSYFNGGNLGIGTTSPGNKLTISGPSSNQFEIINSINSKSWRPNVNGTSFYITETGVSNPFVIQAGGNVGIGTTSPAEKLHVFGGAAAIKIDSTTNEASLKYDNSTSTANIKLANNDLKTELGGAEVMRILAGGNVGIGTTSPGEKLEVDGRIKVQTSAGSLTLQEFGAGSATIAGSGTVGIQAASNFRVKTNYSNEAFTVLSTGNVGIGTTSPAYPLDIQSSSTVALRLNNSSNSSCTIKTDNTYLSLQSAGYILASNPILAYQGLWFLNNKFIRSQESDGTWTDILGLDSSNVLKVGTLGSVSSGGDVAFLVSGSEKMRVAANGNVGIGTTSPVNKQQNKYTSVAINSMTATAGTASTNWNRNAGLLIEESNSSNGLALGVSQTANDRKSWIQSGHPGSAANNLGVLSLNPLGGNVGIGTSNPTDKLYIKGDNPNIVLYSDTLTGSLINFIDQTYQSQIMGSQGTLLFKTGGTNERMRIDNAGNVGIGTTSPGAKLSVNGNVKIEGTNSLLFGGSASIPSWAINHNGSDLLIDDQGGNIGSVLFNNSEGVALPRLTTTQINAISLPAQGLMAYNTTLNTICFYNGSSWQKVSHTSM